MFDRFFRPKAATARSRRARPRRRRTAAGDTATVRRIVAKLEAMPPEQARLIASAAYTLARAANADLRSATRRPPRSSGSSRPTRRIDEATAVLVTEMAKLQAKTVGGTEDYVVTREFKALASDAQRLDVLRACFAIGAANGTISAEETAVVNQIADELDIDDATLNADPRRVPRAALVGPGDPPASPGGA